jgi:O-antigen ligase
MLAGEQVLSGVSEMIASATTREIRAPGGELTGSSMEFRRTRAALLAVAFLAPFSATRLVSSLTLGRALAIGFAVLLAMDLVRARQRLRPDTPATLLAAAYVGLFAWILLSSVTWGCNCDGKVGGFAEFAFVGLLALVAIGVEPRLRETAILAVLSGIALAAVLALLGVGSLNSSTIDLTQTGGRLSGTYGNANELGFAMALGIPIALAYLPTARRRGRIVLGGAVALLSATLVLTYSRGGVIAAGAGAVAVALWLARGSRRRVAIVLAGAAVSVLIAAALYSVFERGRKEASFGSVPVALRPLDQRDRSGWDSRALGPVPHGPSLLSNRASGIAVRATRGGEGASFRWGEAAAGGTYKLRFRARSEGAAGLPFSYALGDGAQAATGRLARGELGPRWRRFSLLWHPRPRAPHATLYVWQRGGASSFELADVTVLAQARGRPAHLVAVPGRLKGSIYDTLAGEANEAEGRYIHSRLDAAHLALKAFASEPLRGIGWGSFPDYSAERLDYGRLAAHDEYLGFAAELGIVGVLLLGLLIYAVVIGIGRVGASRAEIAAVGMLAAAAAGLLFVEALPTPQLSIPLALAAAVVCGSRRTAPG